MEEYHMSEKINFPKAPVIKNNERIIHREDDLRIKDYAIASSINGIAIGDLDGVVTYVNNAALKMWGSNDPSEIIGKPATVFAQSEQEALYIMNTILEKGEWSGEITGRRKNGLPITVLMSASLVRNSANQPTCLMCSFIDITDRKRIEEELRVKESAIASSINGIVIGDLQGNVTYVNEAALKMWGTDNPADILGKPITVFAQSEEEATQIMNIVIEQGYWTGDITGKIMDGSPIIVHLTASMVRNEKGEPINLMCSLMDITDRKRMEEELRIKDLAIASSLDGIGIGDLAGNITYVNKAALKMWGAEDPSEIIGKSAFEFADSREEALKVFEEFMEKGGWSGEISGRRKDGSLFTVHLTSSMVSNEKGEPICIMDSFVDITDRKRMEEELRIKDFAIASSINGIAIGDLNGNITYVNNSFMRLWGGNDPSEILGKSALSFAQSQNEADMIFHSVLEKGDWFGEIIAIRKDGKHIALQITASMVKDDDGKPICLMCSFVDITDRKITEQKLQRAYGNLEQRVEERTEELVKANIRLKKEIEERMQAEQNLLKKEEELSLQSLYLEEANTALKVLLKRVKQDKNELEEEVLSNIKVLALPYLEKIKLGNLDDNQEAYVEILESNLNDIISPFMKKLSSQYINLTPTEIQVANMIREGKSTKEIAELLIISERAIEFHRNNIRDKLSLKKSKTNLRSYLLTFA